MVEHPRTRRQFDGAIPKAIGWAGSKGIKMGFDEVSIHQMVAFVEKIPQVAVEPGSVKRLDFRKLER